MKLVSLIIIITFTFFSATAAAGDGLTKVKSAHGVADTADKLETILKSKGMNVFGRINHSAGAEKAGLTLKPTELLIFGNPKAGTPLMNCAPTIAIDLPQKALIWENAAGEVWLAYNDPAALATRHNLKGCEAVLEKVSAALSGFATAATAK